MFYGTSESRAMTQKEIERINKPSKRERKKFPNAMLCHVWANESQSSGENANGSLYFIGERIYSYGQHYLAAKIFTRDDGTKYALVNSNVYSNSTSNHLIDIKAALRGKMPYYVVPDCYSPNSKENELYLNNDICDSIRSLFETRKKYFQRVEYIKKEVIENNKRLSILGLPNIIITADQWSDLEFLQSERDALENCPIKNAKRDKLKAKRKIALEIKYANQITAYRTFSNVNSIKDFREFRTSKLHTSLGYNHPCHLDYKTQKMLSNNGISIENRHYMNEYDILRVHEIGGVVQTSNSAEVPLSHAIRLLKMILKGEAAKGERVGLFTLDAIDDDPKGDKTIKIGCHKILLSEAVNVLKPYMSEVE